MKQLLSLAHWALALLLLAPAGRALAQTITTVAGTGVLGYSGNGGPATSAQLTFPSAVALDGAGNLFFTDASVVRRVNTSGIITTVAGNGTPGDGGDGGPATSAQLYTPYGMAVDRAGNLFIADQSSYRIRRVSTSGLITTVAGTGAAGFSGDGGAATSAQLNAPTGVALDGAGNLFIADYLNYRIRRVSTSGLITTVAGAGTQGFGGDGGAATSAQLNSPTGVAFDGAGNLFIADRDNNRVRRVAGAGVLAAVPALVAAEVDLFPNPARGSLTVALPAAWAGAEVQAEALDALGRALPCPLTGTGSTRHLSTGELAAGVYTLRLHSGGAVLARRVVVE